MEKVLELLQDEAFVAELDKLEKEDDVIALFKARGATVSMDQLRELIAQLPENGEVSDDDLDKVAGGSIVTILTRTTNPGPFATPHLSKTIWTLKSRLFWCKRW